MYICLCHGVSDKKIKKMVDNGTNTMKAIQSACGAGTDCGVCIRKLQSVITESKDSN